MDIGRGHGRDAVLRPLQALNAFHQMMGAELAALDARQAAGGTDVGRRTSSG
jgi:hypothetical protein